uniref:Uncharacterized protein n=1 Tax=Escherichia phage ETEP102 TaxID=3117680 RepID=A0AAU6PXV8_9CAUD
MVSGKYFFSLIIITFHIFIIKVVSCIGCDLLKIKCHFVLSFRLVW